MVLMININKLEVQEESEKTSSDSYGQTQAHRYMWIAGVGIPHMTMVRKSILAPYNRQSDSICRAYADEGAAATQSQRRVT